MHDVVRPIFVYALLAGVLAASPPAFAVEESRLWLPRTQQELRPLLVAAAELAESSDECEEVVSGEIDVEHSAESAPVFRIVCRNQAGFTYSVRVTDAAQPGAKLEKVHTAGQSGSKVAAEGKTASVAYVQDAAQKCMAVLKLRTSGMKGVTLNENALQQLPSPDGNPQYGLDFDATDLSGTVLRFSSLCRVGGNGAASIEIRPRRNVASESAMPGAGRAATSPPSTTDADPAQAAPQARIKPALPLDRRDSTAADKPGTGDSGAGQSSKPAVDDGWEVIE